MFGVDILALKPGEPVLVVQATTSSTHAARRTKLQEAGFIPLWNPRAGARLEVWSWAKRGPSGSRKTWTVRCCASLHLRSNLPHIGDGRFLDGHAVAFGAFLA